MKIIHGEAQTRCKHEPIECAAIFCRHTTCQIDLNIGRNTLINIIFLCKISMSSRNQRVQRCFSWRSFEPKSSSGDSAMVLRACVLEMWRGERAREQVGYINSKRHGTDYPNHCWADGLRSLAPRRGGPGTKEVRTYLERFHLFTK